MINRILLLSFSCVLFFLWPVIECDGASREKYCLEVTDVIELTAGKTTKPARGDWNSDFTFFGYASTTDDWYLSTDEHDSVMYVGFSDRTDYDAYAYQSSDYGENWNAVKLDFPMPVFKTVMRVDTEGYIWVTGQYSVNRYPFIVRSAFPEDINSWTDLLCFTEYSMNATDHMCLAPHSSTTVSFGFSIDSKVRLLFTTSYPEEWHGKDNYSPYNRAQSNPGLARGDKHYIYTAVEEQVSPTRTDIRLTVFYHLPIKLTFQYSWLSDNANNEFHPVIGSDHNERFYAVWEFETSSGDYDVMGAYSSNRGSSVYPMEIASSSADEKYPRVFLSGKDSFFSYYSDQSAARLWFERRMGVECIRTDNVPGTENFPDHSWIRAQDVIGLIEEEIGVEQEYDKMFMAADSSGQGDVFVNQRQISIASTATPLHTPSATATPFSPAVPSMHFPALLILVISLMLLFIRKET